MNIFQLTKKYTGSPYKLGGSSREEGFDCLSLMLSIAEDHGVKVPETLEGANRENYAELWKSNRPKAIAIFLKLVKTFGTEVPVGQMFAGDIVIAKTTVGETMIGIHAGDDMVMMVYTDVGVQIETLRNMKILRVIKWA